MTKSTLAERMFEAQGAVGIVSDLIGDLLDQVLGSEEWNDFHCDAYERKIAIDGVSGDLSIEQQRQLWAAGFDRCLTHSACYGEAGDVTKHYDRWRSP